LHYSRDHVDITWYPAGLSIIEQGERANSLYLLLSGTAQVIREDGDGTHLCGSTGGEERDMEHVLNDTNCVKVAPYLRQKVEAIAAHRSQFPIQPDLLPLAILQALMGQEYFVPVSLVSEVEPEFLALQGAS
jgi:CRP-like cAMP-binding protein